MRVVVEALAEQHRELDGILTGLDPAGWDRPSRCPGWSVADVVLHLAQTDELALASARGDIDAARSGLGWTSEVDGTVPADMDRAAGDAVDRQRGATGPQVHRRWHAAAEQLRDVLAASDPRQPMEWAVGTLPARTLATTRLAETWIHTGDVCDGLGITQEPSGRLWHVARLAWRTLPYAFAREGLRPSGPFEVAVSAPDGTPWTFSDEPAVTRIHGSALDFCLVAARRRDPSTSDLTATGPDADAALRLVRTFA